MKKLILLMTLLPQLVFAGQGQNLKSVMDNYVFAMTVEWDQKDKEFARSQEEIFIGELRELMKKDLTVDELLATLSAVNPSLNPQVVSEFVKRKSSQGYAEGASWNGDGFPIIWGIAAAGVITAIVLVLVSVSRDEGSSGGTGGVSCLEYDYETRQVCEDRYDYYNNYEQYLVCYDVTDSTCVKYAE
jgi:hypothetical protein